MTLQVSVEKSWLFEGLQPQVLAHIASVGEEVAYPAGAMIHQEGDPASYLYILGQGRVELIYVIHARSPVTMTIGHIEPGDVFGWSSLARNEKYIGNSRTVVDSAVHRIPAAQLFEIMDADPVAGYTIMSRLTRLISHRMHDVRTEIRWFLSSL